MRDNLAGTQTCSPRMKNYTSIEGTLEEFRTSDNTVETTGSLSDHDIVNSIIGVEAEEDDEAETTVMNPLDAVLEVVSHYATQMSLGLVKLYSAWSICH